MKIERRGHGTGHKNSRMYHYKITFNTCEGHEWITYKHDHSLEFCIKCCEFRKKEGS